MKKTKKQKVVENVGKIRKNNKKREQVKFPRNLLAPVGRFLQSRIAMLEKRKKDIETEDPFNDFGRISDNASPDTDAAEQFGHARSSAIRKEIDRKIIQTKKALSRVKIGKYGICEDCGKMIDTDRLIAFPEATLCASCQSKREK